MMVFLPTTSALLDLARHLGCEPNDPAVVATFYQMVLRGHLMPWLPGWWQLSPQLARGVLPGW